MFHHLYNGAAIMVTYFDKNSHSHNLENLIQSYLTELKIKHYSPRTLTLKESILNDFIKHSNCSIHTQITIHNLREYQKALYNHRTISGKKLALSTQRIRLTTIKVFADWLFKKEYIANSITHDFELPQVSQSLPKHIMTLSDVSKVFRQIKPHTTIGLRDRAILETFFSSGIRRRELTHLKIFDLDIERGVLRIREGKGGKERLVPIGNNSIQRILQYLVQSRPKLDKGLKNQYLFLSISGNKLSESQLSSICRKYINNANINKTGSCHIFRHTAATLMLENGADIRVIQSLLGHACLSTTQIYTRVSIMHLKEVHQRTHPANF